MDTTRTNAVKVVVAAAGLASGSVVPSGAALIWNVAPNQNNYVTQTGLVSFAASSATAWPTANGVLAELTFQVQPGARSQASWPIELSGMELTPDGFENRFLPATSATLRSGTPAQPQFLPGECGPSEQGSNLVFTATPGLRWAIEFSTDLNAWQPVATVTAQAGPNRVVDAEALGKPHRFYRIKLTQ